MPDQIKWPKGTPRHIRRPACPACPDCGELVPTRSRHDCPKRAVSQPAPEAAR
jgi:hypothetical protein